MMEQNGNRTREQLFHHYHVEKELAERLRRSTREERSRLYGTLYDNLYRLVPDHPRHVQPSRAIIEARIKNKLGLVAPLLKKGMTVMEFGPGDCSFAYELCRHVSDVYAIDLSDQRVSSAAAPSNFHLLTFDGYNVPTAPGMADLVFSDQLLEHLHPDDTLLHFQLVRAVLRPGGTYVLRTPHRLSGPHDISGYFVADRAEGFHLREWSYREIRPIIEAAGYGSCRAILEVRGRAYEVPCGPMSRIEAVLEKMPRRAAKLVARRTLNQVICRATVAPSLSA